MRVQDIIVNETDIVEAPAGMLGQIGRKIGAKVAGAVGAKGKAAELTGKVEVGKEANELKVSLLIIIFLKIASSFFSNSLIVIIFYIL